MRLLSIIKVIVVMIDARSEWNVKDGQTKFYEYYLKRVKPEYQDAAQHLLKESFKSQADGNFDDNFINKFVKETQVYIETDKLTEVLEIIEHFCTGHFNN